MHNGAQGCCPARGDAVRRRGGEGRKTWRDATRRPQTNAGGRHGRDEAAGRARAAVARAMAIHDVAVRNAYAVAQAAVATRASRHRDAQRLVAQSSQDGNGRDAVRLWLDLDAETERAFADALTEGEAKLAEAERAMEALQKAMADLRDAEDAAAARLSLGLVGMEQTAAVAVAGDVRSSTIALCAAGQPSAARRGRMAAGRRRRAGRSAGRASVSGYRAAGPAAQAASGQKLHSGGTGELLRAPAAWVRPSRARGARGGCGDACALGPCSPGLFGQPSGRPPGGVGGNDVGFGREGLEVGLQLLGMGLGRFGNPPDM